MKKLFLTAITILAAFSGLKAQVAKPASVERELQADVNRAAGMFYARTPPPLKARNPSTLIIMAVLVLITSTSQSITLRPSPPSPVPIALASSPLWAKMFFAKFHCCIKKPKIAMAS